MTKVVVLAELYSLGENFKFLDPGSRPRIYRVYTYLGPCRSIGGILHVVWAAFVTISLFHKDLITNKCIGA